MQYMKLSNVLCVSSIIFVFLSLNFYNNTLKKLLALEKKFFRSPLAKILKIFIPHNTTYILLSPNIRFSIPTTGKKLEGASFGCMTTSFIKSFKACCFSYHLGKTNTLSHQFSLNFTKTSTGSDMSYGSIAYKLAPPPPIISSDVLPVEAYIDPSLELLIGPAGANLGA